MNRKVTKGAPHFSRRPPRERCAIFPLLILSVLISATAAFTSCSSSDDDDHVFAVVRSNLIFGSKAEVGQIEVNSTLPYTATTDKAWCKATVTGSIVRVEVEKNNDFESRNATVTLQSGERRLLLPVAQMGSIWAIRGADTYLTSDEDTTLIIPATLDFDYTVQMPEWMEGKEVEGGYQLHLLDNTTGAGREGTVTFNSTVGSKTITFRQFGQKSVCGTYTAAFRDTEGLQQTRDVELVATDTKNRFLLQGLSTQYSVPMVLDGEGNLKVPGSELVTYEKSIGYLYTVLHCVDNTDFTQQGYYYAAALKLTKTDERLIPSFAFVNTVINYKDMFEQDLTATVDGFSLITYTQPNVSFFFEDKRIERFTALSLNKKL